MKKILPFFLILFSCLTADADTILLKNGEIIEGKVTHVRGIFIRVEPYDQSPFREFLIENVAHIEQSEASEASVMAIENIHRRAIIKARERRLQEAAQQRADALIEEAIQNSGYVTLNTASEQVKAVAQQRASALIEEAVKTAEAPRLESASNETKTIAKEKAGGVIEQAVRDVEVLPLQRAPENIRIAAAKAASRMIEGAVIDAESQSASRKAGGLFPFFTQLANWSEWISFPELTTKDYVIAGLIALLLALLLREKVRGRTKPSGLPKKASTINVSLKQLEKEMAEFEKATSGSQKKAWSEKRKYPRVDIDLPVSLILDKVKPISAMVKNISLGGVYALCNDLKLLRLGDQCQFKIGPDANDPHFMVYGEAKVVRIRSSRGLGLRFTELDQNSINHLSKFAA